MGASSSSSSPIPAPKAGSRVMAAGRLLALVQHGGPITRAEATTRLGLARSAVGAALEELTELGLVHLVSSSKPSAGYSTGRGRPSPIVEADPNGPVVIAVQMLPDRVILAVVGLGQRIHHLSEHTLGGMERDPEAVTRLVAGMMTQAADQCERRCVGACVAMPGFVREIDGFVHSSLHLGWRDVPFGEQLTAHSSIGRPVMVGRASGLAALAEYGYGAGRGAAGILALNCEHLGVGGGFITGGTLLAGTGYALEAGHLIVEPAGLHCPCGARGCLEMYADARALLRATGLSEDQARNSPGRVPEVLASASIGDPSATEAVRATARHLAVGLTGLVNTLSPERVVLLGFLADLYKVAGDLIREELTRSSIVARAGQVTVTTGSLSHPVLLGAADRALAPLLASPRVLLDTD